MDEFDSEIDLPASWQIKTIADVYRFTKKPRELKPTPQSRIPFVPMDKVPQGGGLRVEFIEREFNSITSGTYFERGDILLSKITPSFENGKQGIADDIPADFGYASTEVIPIQEIKGISDKRFLFYYMLLPSVRHAIASRMEGSTGRQRVPDVLVRGWKIPFPPLVEQRAIASILWKLQQAIEVETDLIRVSRELKAAVMSQLFTKGLKGEPQKETEIGLVPESWDVVPLGEVLKVAQYGMSVRGQQCGRYPILRMNCQIDGRVHFNNLQYVDSDEKTFASFKLNKQDLLFNRTNSIELVGRMAIFDSVADAVFASYLIRLTLKKEIAHPEFVNYYFNLDATQRRLKYLAQRGVSQANINASKLRLFLVPLPSPAEQEKIINTLMPLDQLISAHEEKCKALTELFTALLSKLMSAEIRVTDLDLNLTNPASSRSLQGAAA